MKKKLITILLFVWQLPQNLIGILFLIYFLLFKNKLIKNIEFDSVRNCFRIEVNEEKFGLGLGFFIFYSCIGKDKDYIELHELGHGLCSMILGPLFFPLICIPSTFLRIAAEIFKRNEFSTKWYFKIYPERWASVMSGIENIEMEI